MNENDLTTQLRESSIPGNTPSANFDRRVHMVMNLYAIAVVAYVSYSVITQSGLMRLWIRWMDAGWISIGVGTARGLFPFFVSILALLLPVLPAAFVARRFAPSLAGAIDSWGRPKARRTGLQSWRSIFTITGAIAIFAVLITAVIFFGTQSVPARKIHEIDLRDKPAVLPSGANYVRLTGVVPRRFWLVYDLEDGSGSVSIAPMVSERWSPNDPVRYFVFANGKEPAPFEKSGPIRFSGEPGRTPSDIEHQAMARYHSMGLKVDQPYVMVKSRDLPEGAYAPVDYDTLVDCAGIFTALTLAAFGAQAIGRYKAKRKIGRYEIRLR